MTRSGAAGLALLIALLLPGAGGWAAEPTPQTLGPGQMLRGHFVQERQLAGFAKPLRSSGRFVLVHDRGLIWRGETPFQTTTVITSSGILQLIDGQAPIRLPAARLPALARFYDALSGALSGDPAKLEQDFRVERTSEGTHWQLRLVPARTDDPALAQVTSIVVTGAALVDAVEIRKAGGDAERLQFEEQTLGPADMTADEAALLDDAGR